MGRNLAIYSPNRTLVLIALLFAFVVIVLGAYTRLTDAGLSCPDWPHCYGFTIAPYTPAQLQQATKNYPANPIDIKKAWTEMTHRYAAGIEGLLLLAIALPIFFSKKIKKIKTVSTSLILIALLTIQVLLGMLTVTKQLTPTIVLLHLLTGIFILCVLWWIYLDLGHHPQSSTKISTPILAMLWFAIALLLMQITLGGWVSTHYAGLACIDFPYCHNEWLPKLAWDRLDSDLISIHMLHRIGALIVMMYFILLTFFLLTKPVLRSLGFIMLTLLALQIALGILNILWLRPIWIALFHQAIAIILLLTVLAILLKANTTTRDNPYDIHIS